MVNSENSIPKYALSANPKRLVVITCKGKCKNRRYAEMNYDYPGRELLNKSPENVKYMAICLKCGFKALDPYNWGEVEL